MDCGCCSAPRSTAVDACVLDTVRPSLHPTCTPVQTRRTKAWIAIFDAGAVDARLLVAGKKMYMSHVNLWGATECVGHFLARLRLRLDAPPDNEFNRLAELVSTEATGGLNVMGSPGKLRSVRNGGVLVNQNRISMELSDVAPFTEVLTATGELTRFPVPPRFSAFMHNSMHPIWVPELSAFLGVVRNPAATICCAPCYSSALIP